MSVYSKYVVIRSSEFRDNLSAMQDLERRAKEFVSNIDTYSDDARITAMTPIQFYDVWVKIPNPSYPSVHSDEHHVVAYQCFTYEERM